MSIQTKAQDEHLPLSAGQALQGLLNEGWQGFALTLLHHGFVYSGARSIRDEVSQDRFVGPWYGSLQTHGTLIKQGKVQNALGGKTREHGDLLNSGFSSLLCVEGISGTLDLTQLSMHIDGQTNGSGSITKGTQHALLEPVHGVRAEFDALVRVEVLHRGHQAKTAFLKEVL